MQAAGGAGLPEREPGAEHGGATKSPPMHSRFTDLLRELAVEHATLSRGLQEARAEVERLQRAQGTGCSRPGSCQDGDAHQRPLSPPELTPDGCPEQSGGTTTDSSLIMLTAQPEDPDGQTNGRTRRDGNVPGLTSPGSDGTATSGDSLDADEVPGGNVRVAGRSGELSRIFSLHRDIVRSLTVGAISALSVKFDMIVGTFIVLNACVMAMEIEYAGLKFQQQELNDCVGSCGELPALEDTFFALEHMFTGIFFLELVVRLKWEGRRYLYFFTNFLDAVIVLVSMVDSWVLGPLGEDSMGNVAVLRLMRLLRLAKVLRVMRVMKAFTSLRVLVEAVANSVGALAWSMTLLFVLELIGAIFMAQVLKPFMEADSVDEELRDFLFAHFGTWSNAMFTIFEVTMAPGGFTKYRRVYQEVHPFFGVFFVVYVCIVTFAVVRVITALFLRATLAASAKDERVMAQNRAMQHTEYVFGLKEKLATDFNEEPPRLVLDTSACRTIVEDTDFQKWLSEVDLSPNVVYRIYGILEGGGNGAVYFDDWAEAVLQLARPAQHVDTIINLYETRSCLRRVMEMERMVRDGLGFAKRLEVPQIEHKFRERITTMTSSHDSPGGSRSVVIAGAS